MRAYSQRFWSKVGVGAPDECWPWLASLRENGYGQFNVAGRMAKAHRVAWELRNGPIPDGLVIDHLCRNRVCVNPNHLDLTTQGENVRRGLKSYAIRDKCKHGHDITDPSNVKVDRRTRLKRCRVCAREDVRHSRARQRMNPSKNEGRSDARI